MDVTPHKTSGRRVMAAPIPAPHPVRAAAAPAAVQCQTYTRVSSPSDPAEREAVDTANRIMRMPGTGGSPYVHRFAGAIARQGTAPPRVTPEVSGGIAASAGSGSPLPSGVRSFMEPRFRADFSQVRVHTGDNAARLSRQLNAQAFTTGPNIFFGQGRFQPDTHDGRTLIAHELTHTIQQGASVQRAEDTAITARTGPEVQRLGMDDVLDFFADKANLLPGFRLLTILIGLNPINRQRVERSAANILRAVIELLPGGGIFTRALDAYGILEKAGAFVEQQLQGLGMTASLFTKALGTFVDSLGVTDLLNPGGVWTRAQRIFTEPIARMLSFVKGLATGLLQLVREAVLTPLAGLAQNTRGYPLLKAVIGQDPITGEAYPRNAETLIGGFMTFIGQDEIWANIKKSNAIARAWAWFQTAITTLMGFVRQIPTQFMHALRSLEIGDLVLPPRAWLKLAGAFGDVALRFAAWAAGTVWSLLEIIFAVVAPGVLEYIKKAGTAFRTILKNPIGFVGNLVSAARKGFEQFASRLGFHLKKSLIEWLTGTLSGIDVYIPKAFEIKEFIRFVLSLLGLTWQNIRQKLVKAAGETAVTAMETGFDIVMTLVTQGPAAAWEKIREQLTNLKEIVFEEIGKFVMVKIVQSAVTKIIGMLFPAAAVIEAIVATYNTIMFFVERMKQIIKVVAAFIDSIAAIASGAIAAAANKVEETLGGYLTLAISFLARLIGLGKVSTVVTNILDRVRAPIDKALDKVVEWIVAGAKKLGKMAVATARKVIGWWRAKVGFKAGTESHSLFFTGEGAKASLTVASTPLPIKAFVDAKRPECKGIAAKEKAIAQIDAQLPAINACIALAAAETDEKTLEALQKQIEGELNKLAVPMVALLSDTEWGTEANPAPLDYQKRRADAYPTFYLTTLKAPMTQAELKANFGKPGFTNSIWKYAPTVQTPLPLGDGEPLGLGADSQVDVGRKICFDDKGVRGSGVSRFKSAVDKYGMTASASGWDIDHVVELQIGGKDVFSNLWPLPSGENRSSGSIIKEAKIEKPGKQAISVALAFEEKKKAASKLWMVVRTTRQR